MVRSDEPGCRERTRKAADPGGVPCVGRAVLTNDFFGLVDEFVDLMDRPWWECGNSR